MSGFGERRAAEEAALREARAEGKSSTHMLEGKNEAAWRAHDDAIVRMRAALVAFA
ncbi:hypothetical protein GCM10008949_44690 [Deinococcus humi]|nr:hypothetical protein GCM10008949_44690 [Deinococcus humi]